MADSRKMDCFGESHDSPRNDEVEPLELSLRDSTRSVESWQSTKDSQAKFRANEVDLSNICAEILTRISTNRHAIFLLNGDIGAGKTTLVKAFAKYVKIKDSVTSPTFSLLHIYESKNQSRVSATESRPIRGAKNRNQTSSSASADFLLESEKRGSPPKSEKAAAFWCVGGAGRGVQPFLRKENYESNVNCHDFAMQNLAMTGNNESVESYNDEKISKIYHYDLYQKGVDYAIDLGLLDLLEQRGIHFVEWGDSQLFGILKNAFENICIISIHKTKNDRIYEFKESF